MEISYEEFRKVKIHVGTIKAVEENKRAHKPALALEIEDRKSVV
jgi:tRNA-binding EMAP/Myf-like protein